MRHNSCLSNILRHISFMKGNEIFTTRAFTIYGKRANVDNALFQLVRAGFIKRLTPGVFVRWTSNFTWPSVFEIAKIKAAAFGKALLLHGVDTGAKHKLVPASNKEATYYVDGSTSRFRYRGAYINLKKASKKRMHLPDDNAGLAIRALWSLGEKNLKKHHIQKLDRLWNVRVEREKIYKGKAWMPAWLGDWFLTSQYVGPFPPGQKSPQRV